MCANESSVRDPMMRAGNVFSGSVLTENSYVAFGASF